MKARRIHPWHVTTADARAIQEALRHQVIRQNDGPVPRFVAGADISFKRNGIAIAAAVVLSFPDMELVETSVVEGRPEFPYIPGLLTFREAPLILAVFERLKTDVDLVLVDGQGIAHPRRFGIASHLGLLLDTPAIGCAKSRLCGEHDEPPPDAGTWTELIDGGETIGAVVRSRRATRPLYVSIGHKVDLTTAVTRILQCCRGYRLPEPTRLAHLAAAGNPLAPVVRRADEVYQQL